MKLFRRLILLLVTTPMFATTYYIATTGSDSNTTTQAQNPSTPWLTMQHAVDTMVAGDTTLVEDGIYTAATQNPSCTGGENTGKHMVGISNSGTSGAYITLRSQNKWGAILDSGVTLSTTTGCAEAIRFTGGNYIRVQDLVIRNFTDLAFNRYSSTSTNIDIVGNWVHDIGRYCTNTTSGRDGFFLDGGNFTVEQNVFSDIGKYAVGENGCASAPYINQDHGIYVAGSATIMIRNNIFYRIEHGFAVQNYPYGGSPTISILNNTISWCNNQTQRGCIVNDGAGTMLIENNISYDPSDALLYTGSTQATTCTVNNNLVSNSTGLFVSGGQQNCTISGNIVNTNPLLVNVGVQTMDTAPLTPDAHETSISPGIGHGVTLSDVTNDYAGNPRPSGSYDIGAYQFTTGTAPNPPTSLTVTVH